jgi:hypothetical protein
VNQTSRSPITTEQVFAQLANQQVQWADDLALELGFADCVRLSNGSAILRHRDGHYEQLHDDALSKLEFVGGGDAGSLLTDLALSRDFPLGAELAIQSIWERLGVSPDTSLDELRLKLAKLRGRDYKMSLCLAYGEMLRRRVAGEWLGIAAEGGIEPALVTRRSGIIHYAGYLLRLATKRKIPDFELLVGPLMT